MGKRVPYGEVDLKKIRTERYLYIDKTMYIEKLEKNSKIIFTRPRRFGKSMLTSMLAYYYSINEAENFHMYNLNKEINKDKNAAGILREFLNKFELQNRKTKIYIMIDEYDHFTNGILKGDAKKFLTVLGVSGFVRSFYEVIKEKLETIDPPIERFFATGAAPVTLDSLTSGFNIATKLTNNPIFTSMCGLTEEEVKYAIKEADVPNLFYNGYITIGSVGVRNKLKITNNVTKILVKDMLKTKECKTKKI